MDLYDYFFKLKKETGIEMQEFAKQLEISTSHASCLVHKKRFASFLLAQKIEKKTNGKVSMVEIMKERQNPKLIPLQLSKSRNKKKNESVKPEQLQLNLQA